MNKKAKNAITILVTIAFVCLLFFGILFLAKNVVAGTYQDYPIKDTYLYSGASSVNFNYGASISMIVRNGSAAFRDISLVHGNFSSIPTNSTINYAYLHLRGSAGSSVAFNIYMVNGSWDEGTGTGSVTGDGATWNNRTGSAAWIATGGDYIDVLISSDTYASGYKAYNIKPAMEYWVNGSTPNNGLLLKGVTSTQLIFYTKEQTGTSFDPYFNISYSEPQPIFSNLAPVNNSAISILTQYFTCNATMLGVDSNANITRVGLWVSTNPNHDYAGGIGYMNQSYFNATIGNVSANYTFGTDGIYYWFCDADVKYENGVTVNLHTSEERRLIIDNSPPVITLISPTPSSNSNISTNSITVNASVTDYTGVSTCLLQFDATNYTMTKSGTICNYTLSGISDGSHTFKVYANDTYGFLGNSSSVTYLQDTVKPQIQFVSPTRNSGNITGYNFIEVNVTASDSYLKNITIYLYNSTNALNQTYTTATSPNYKNFSSLSEGVWFYNATASDYAENTNSTETRNITIDRTSPVSTASATSPPGGSSYTFGTLSSQNVNVTISATDAVAGVNTSLYPIYCVDITNTCTPSTYIGGGVVISTEGTSYIRYNSVDYVGNIETIKSSTIKIDTVKPQIQFVSPTETNNSYLTRNNILVNVTASDTNFANITTRLYNSTGSNIRTNVSTSSPYFINYTGLSDGIYYFNSTATDLVGNTNSTETRLVTIDATPPTLNYVSPTENSGVYFDRNYILVNVTAVDSTLNNIQIRLYNSSNSLLFTNNSATSPFYINYSSLTEGRYFYNVTGNDSAGNTATLSTRNITLDRTFPTIAFALPTPTNNSNQSSTSIIVNFTGTELNVFNGIINFNGTNYSATCTGSGSYSCSRTFSGLANGIHNFTGYINDSVGHINSTEIRFVRVDNVAPLLTVLYPTNNLVLKDVYTYNVSLNVSATDSGVGIDDYFYSLNGAANITFTPNITITGIAGTNTLRVYVNDTLNNVNTTTIVFNLTFTPKINNINISNSTTSYASSDISTGLIGWWSFDENRTDLVMDKAGTKNATIVGSPLWTDTDKVIGGAFDFNPNANNKRIQIGTVAQFAYGNISDKAFTIAGWVRRNDTTSNSESYLMSNQRANSGCTLFGSQCSGFSVGISPSSFYFTVQVFNSTGTLLGNTITFSSTYSSGTTWHYYAVTHNGTRGTNATLYIDGIARSISLSGNGATDWYTDLQEWGEASNEILTIGENPQHSGTGFNGTIDEVRIYNRSLSASEISQLYSITNPTFPEYPNITINQTITDEDTSSASIYYQWFVNGVSVLTGFAQNILNFIFTLQSNTVQSVANDTNNYTVTQNWNITTTFVNPTINFTLPTPANNTWVNSTSIVVNFTGTEANRNIGWVRFNNTNYTATCVGASPYYCNQTISGIADGQYNLTAYINDSVGNQNNTETRLIKIDTTAPTTTASATSPPGGSSYTFDTWTKNTVRVLLSGFDATSNFNNLAYPIYCADTSNTCTPSAYIGAGVTISTDAISYIRYFTVDNAGNYEVIKNRTIKIDTTAPTLSILYPTSSLNFSYNTSIPLNFTMADSQAGVGSCWYSLNSGATNTTIASCQNTTFSTTEGAKTLILYVNDSVGNLNSTNVSFNVDLTKPLINIFSPQATNYRDAYNLNVSLNMSATDSLSGVQAYKYSLNSGATNTTFTPNTTFIGSIGANNLNVYVSDKAGNENVSTVTFNLTFTPKINNINISNSTNSYARNGFNQTGLVTWYKLDKNWSTQEDSQAGLNNLSVNGSMFTDSGLIGGAYNFDGVNDYMNISPVTPLIPNSSLTVAFWSKQLATSTSQMNLFSLFGSDSMTIYVTPDTYSYLIKYSNISGTTYNSFFSNLDDNWHYIVSTFDGSRIRVYIDNSIVLNQTAPGQIIKLDNSLFIGTRGNASGVQANYFNGILDEVMIFNRTLSTSEISQLYSITNPTFPEYPNITINQTITDEDTSSASIYYQWFVNGVSVLTGFAQNILNFIFTLQSNTVQSVANDTNNYTVTQNWNITTTFVNPLISFVSPTETSGSNKSVNWLGINVSTIENNLANITIYLYNSTGANIRTNSSSSSPYFINYTGLSDGIYYFNATATDLVGNQNSTETRNVVIDTTKPSNVIIYYPAATNYKDNYNYSIALNVSAIDATTGIKNYTYSLNGATNTTFTPNTTVTGLIAGQNTILVTATDYVGNQNSSTILFNLTFTPKINNINVSNSTTSYARNDILNGLVGWWKFDENNTVIKDYSGNGFNGTTTGTNVNYVDGGVIGGAEEIKNIGGSYITITDNVLLRPISVSECYWVKFNNVTANWSSSTPVLKESYTNSTFNAGYYIRLSSSKPQFNILNNGSRTSGTGPTMLVNTWYYLCGTYNGTVNSLYINGQIVNSTTYGINLDIKNTTANIIIGQNSNPFYFNGTIDEVRIYNRSLSASEISQLYSITNPTFPEYPNITINQTITDEDTSSASIYYQWFVNGVSVLTGFAQNILNFIFTLQSNTVQSVANDTNNYTVTQNWNITTTFVNPLISFVSPTETSGSYKNSNVINVNITASDTNFANITTRLYNSTGANIRTNSSSSSPYFINYTGLSDGIYYFNATATDLVGNTNSTETRNTTIDTANPIAILNTPANNSYSALTSINYTVNLTDETSIKNVTLNIANSTGSLINQTTTLFNVGAITANIGTVVVLNEGVYTWYYNVYDYASNSVNSTTRTITIDTTNPTISFVSPTENSGVNLSRNWIVANVSVTETNFANITFNLYNTTALVNSTKYLDGNRTINWILLPNARYSYNVTIYDQAGNTNSTETRAITLDTISPNSTLLSPNNNSYVNNGTQNYTTNLTDSLSGLANATIIITNSTGSLINQTTTILIGQLQIVIGTVVTLVDDVYNWFYQIFDFAGNIFNSQNGTITIDTTNPTIIYNPNTHTNNTWNQNGEIFINITASDTNKDTVKLDFNGLNQSFDSNSGNTYWSNKSGLSTGTYTFYAWINDTATNFNRTDTRTAYIDRENPTVEILSPPDGQSFNYNTSILLNFTATDSNLQSCWYNFNDGTNISITCNTSTTFNISEGTLVLRAFANDSSGRIGTDISTFQVNLAPPSVVIHFPSNNLWLNYKDNVQFNYTATDSDGISSSEFYINSTGTWHLNQTHTPTSAVLDTFLMNLTDGSFAWNIRVNDTGNNQVWASLTNRTINVDTIYPLISFSVGTDSDLLNKSSNLIQINLSLTEINLANITYRLYNSTGSLINTTTFGTSINSLNFSGLADGRYSYNATAIDRAGNTNSTTTRTITIDTTNPNISLLSPINASYSNSSNVNFTANLTDGLSGIKNSTLRVYNSTGSLINQTTTILTGQLQIVIGTVVTLVDDVYNWFYQIFDFAGNIFNSQNGTITIDTTNPTISFVSPTENSGVNLSRNWIVANVSVTELNEKNITFNLYNSTALVNSTTSTSQLRFINWSTLIDGTYFYNITIYDQAGNTNSTETRNITIDDTPPAITIYRPQATNYANNNSIALDYTVTDDIVGIQSCYYQVYNSTGSLIIDPLTQGQLPTCENTTFSLPGGDVDYILTLFAFDNLNNPNSATVTFGIRTISPAIQLNNPIDNKYFSTLNNIRFNFTATDSDGISVCKLYGNWSSGWHINQTLTSVISGQQTNFNLLNLTEDTFKWNVWCNDTFNNVAFALNNYTFTTDITYPITNITSISTTQGSQTITFNSTTSDLHLSSCKYTIVDSLTGLVDGINENVSFTCNSPRTAVVSDFGEFNLTIYAIDLSGNEIFDIDTFTTIPSIGGGGGGGGGTPKTVDKIAVVALKDISNATSFVTPLQRAILYARLSEECRNFTSAKVRVCVLPQSSIDTLLSVLSEQGVDISKDILLKWLKQLNGGEIENVNIEKPDVDKYKLSTSIITLLDSEFVVTPKSIDTFWIVLSDTFKTKVSSNRELKEVKIIGGELGFNAVIVNKTIVEVTYKLQSNQSFTFKTFTARINYVDISGNSIFQDVAIRAINVAQGGFMFLIIGGIIVLGLFVFVYRKNVKRNLNGLIRRTK